MRVGFTTTIVFFTYANSPGYAFAHCPEFPTAASGGVVFIPRVVDASLKSTMDHRLTTQNLIPYNNILNRYTFYIYKIKI